MDYSEILKTLEELRELINTEGSHNLIAEKYGMIQDVYRQIIPKQSIKVEVPRSGHRLQDTYPNFFEAGFLSGRTFHRHQGKMELSKVIGEVKKRVSSSKLKNEKANNYVVLTSEIKEEYKMQIGMGNLKKVISNLIEHFKKSGSIPNPLFMLFNQFSEFEKKEIEGTEEPEAINRRKNKLVKGLLNYIDTI